ncbi:MAG: hypothetical protein HY763_01975 [Planctomycetes bacterium]|nr:hypothetical protein [Planctomycetota bacterium]
MLCYLRRLLRRNGMCVHVYVEGVPPRTGRATGDRRQPFAPEEQLVRLLRAGWNQLEGEPAELHDVLDHTTGEPAILERCRCRLANNDRAVAATHAATLWDELPPTGTVLGSVNAMLRVAAHTSASSLTPGVGVPYLWR